MNKKRWIIALIALAVVMASSLIGNVRSYMTDEAFYRGKPASYWSRELGKWKQVGFGRGQCVSWSWFRPIAAWEFWVGDHAPRLRGLLPDEPPILRGDPKALAVLAALLDDPNPQVRRIAAHGLAQLEELAKPAVAKLVKHLDDPDLVVRDEVEDALLMIDSEMAKIAIRPSSRFDSRCHPVRSDSH